MTDLDELKYCIRTKCMTKLDHAVIAVSVDQWRRRLSGCRRLSAITTTFLTVVHQSNTCTQNKIARPEWFNIVVVSYDFALCNRQGEVATLIK